VNYKPITLSDNYFVDAIDVHADRITFWIMRTSLGLRKSGARRIPLSLPRVRWLERLEIEPTLRSSI